RRSLDARFFYGEALLQVADYAQAHDQYVAYLEQRGLHRHARQASFRAGESAYLAGNLAAAEKHLTRFVSDHRADEWCALAVPYLGQIALSRNDVAQAQAHFIDALDRFAGGPFADECRFGLGKASEQQGQITEALRFYGFVADRAGPLQDRAVFASAMLLIENDPAEAEKALSRFQSEWPASHLRTQAVYRLGQLMSDQDRWTEAAAVLGPLAEAVPQTDSLALTVRFAAAVSHKRSGDSDAATDWFASVARAWPESEWADEAIAEQVLLAVAAENGNRAVALLNQLAANHPDSPHLPPARRGVAQMLIATGESRRAAAVLEPTRQDAAPADRYQLALAELQQRHYTAALRLLADLDLEQLDNAVAAGVLVARASALVGLKRHADAVAPLRAYAERFSTTPDAARMRAQLAIALAETGQYEAAYDTWGALIDIYPDAVELTTVASFVAETFYRAERPRYARGVYLWMSAHADADTAAQGIAGLAWTHLDNDDLAASAAAFEELLNRYPNHPLAAESAFMRARTLERMQQFDPALAMYAMVRKDYADTKHAAAAIIAAAQLHGQLKQTREARRLLEDVLVKHPTAANIDAARYQLAWILKEQGESEKADEQFALVARDIGSRYAADSLFRIAERRAQRREFTAAADYLQQFFAREDVPEHVAPHALYLQGQIAAKQSRWTDVSAPMRRLLADHPTHDLASAAQFWLAEAVYRQGDYEQAERQFARLVVQTQGRDSSWLAMAPLRQAQALAQQKRWTEAHKIAKGIAKRFPDFRQQYEVDYLIGRCLGSRAEFEAAREAYRRVVQSPAGSQTETASMAQWMIGETYFHQDKYERAIRAYHRVLRHPRWRAAALLQAGKCHEMKGEWSRAIDLYREVVEDFSNSPYAADAKRRLHVATERARLASRSGRAS
ncbi:MAG: tetratricopeptide repeat protein, partial [Pirellulaceae bacterium]|nr:tetratricopeptide repeat protein [Pirellulaceae bacterium]